MLKVLADILRAVDGGNIALLTLLDLSAAFDTVDHATLLQRLESSYGSAVTFTTGSLPTCLTELSFFVAMVQLRDRNWFCVEFRKDRSSGRSFFSSTLLTCCSSSSVTVSARICLPTTHRFTVSVLQKLLYSSRTVYLVVSTMSLIGCAATDCS